MGCGGPGRHHQHARSQALAFDGLIAEHVASFYEDQASINCARLAMLRHTIFGGPAPDPPAVTSDQVMYARVRAAALFDDGIPRVLRALGDAPAT
jgi:hypothetical protein